MEKTLDPGFKKIANHILSAGTRHHRYCPCCREYDVGKEPSAFQMGEFLEYIKQLHYKMTGGKPKENYKPSLDYDSIDEVSDLDEPGILTTSANQLSMAEQRKVKKYISEMRRI